MKILGNVETYGSEDDNLQPVQVKLMYLLLFENEAAAIISQDPAKESESVCLRPDIFLSNDRHCDGCHHFKICRSRLKTLPKHVSFDGNNFVYDEGYKTKKKK